MPQITKSVTSVLICTMAFGQFQPALAQLPTTVAPRDSTQSMQGLQDCILRGRADGLEVSTGGAFGVGLAGGLLLGLVGAAIAYAAQGEPEPNLTRTLISLEGRDPSCVILYSDAFGKAGKKKKQTAALSAGLFGTAILVVLVVQASHQSNKETVP